MTTENGMEELRHARRNIDVLREFLAYLDDWIAEHERVTGVVDTGVRAQEARAVRWALPVLEAEWDNLRRMNERYIMPSLNALHSSERREAAAEKRAKVLAAAIDAARHRSPS